MSYDIWYCCRSDQQFDRYELRQSLASLPHTTESENNDGSLVQFDYDNPDTGVYCLFDLYEPTAEDGFELPEGFNQVGVSVSINFLRPRFFVAELMPMIANFAEANNLLIVDPQQDEIRPETPDSANLIERWITSNERVTRGMARQADHPIHRPYLAPEDSMGWWNYSRAKNDYQDAIDARGEDIFVPSIRFALDSQKRVRRVVQWSASELPLAQVFPPCDHLMLAWDFDPEQQRPPTTHNIRIGAADRLLPLLEPIDGPVEGLRVLRPANQTAAIRVFEDLSRAEGESLDFIGSDSFVDVLV